VALTENIFYGKPTGRSSERTTMAVVAQINDDADRWIRSVVGGRPLAGSVMQAAGNFGAITLRDGSVKAKVQSAPPVYRRRVWRVRFRRVDLAAQRAPGQ